MQRRVIHSADLLRGTSRKKQRTEAPKRVRQSSKFFSLFYHYVVAKLEFGPGDSQLQWKATTTNVISPVTHGCNRLYRLEDDCEKFMLCGTVS